MPSKRNRPWPDAAQIFLTFAGTDGDEKVFGAAGDVAYNAQDEETITGTLRYHHGDDIPFVWKRALRYRVVWP